MADRGGGGATTTSTQTSTQNTVVNVSTNVTAPPITISGDILKPLGDVFGPLTQGIADQLRAGAQLNADLRRTANFSPVNALAAGAGGISIPQLAVLLAGIAAVGLIIQAAK